MIGSQRNMETPTRGRVRPTIGANLAQLHAATNGFWLGERVRLLNVSKNPVVWSRPTRLLISLGH